MVEDEEIHARYFIDIDTTKVAILYHNDQKLIMYNKKQDILFAHDFKRKILHVSFSPFNPELFAVTTAECANSFSQLHVIYMNQKNADVVAHVMKSIHTPCCHFVLGWGLHALLLSLQVAGKMTITGTNSAVTEISTEHAWQFLLNNIKQGTVGYTKVALTTMDYKHTYDKSALNLVVAISFREERLQTDKFISLLKENTGISVIPFIL